MSQRRDPACRLLGAILLLYVVLAVSYSLTIPLGEAPDEVPHFTYVRYLARHGRLPTTTEEHEAFQPPLYYVLGAALTFWIGDEPDTPFAVRANAHYDVTDPRAPKNLLLHTAAEAWPYRGWALSWHLVRLLSIALGAVTIWTVFHLGRVLFPARPAIPLGMAALTAFTPQFLFMSAVANNDNAVTAFSALILWQVAALLHDEESRRIRKRSLLLGLLLGLGLLSKANLIALAPIVAMAVAVATIQSRPHASRFTWHCSRFTFHASPAASSVLRIAGNLFLTFGLATLLSGWYFVRNWVLFGDPLGWAFTLQVSALREGPLSLEVLAWLFRGLFRSFWLGWIGIQFEGWIYWLLGAACLVGLAGTATWLIRGWKRLGGGTRWTLGLLALHLAITLASLIRWTATVLGTDQGRLIFPVLPTIMLVIVAGWAWWARGRAESWVLGGLAAGTLALAIVTPSRYIGPVHAPASVATDAELSSASRLNVDWNGVRLLGYSLESNEIRAGEKLILHLYWQALEPISRDLMLLIQLVDEEGQFLMYVDGSPSAGRDTTDRWTPGVPLVSTHLLPVPEHAQPGPYRLTLSFHPFGEQTWLPATDSQGTPLGDHFALPERIDVEE